MLPAQQHAKWLTHEQCLGPFFTYIHLLSMDRNNECISEAEQEILILFMTYCSCNVLIVQYCKLPLLEAIAMPIRGLLNDLTAFFSIPEYFLPIANRLIEQASELLYPYAAFQNTD